MKLSAGYTQTLCVCVHREYLFADTLQIYLSVNLKAFQHKVHFYKVKSNDIESYY